MMNKPRYYTPAEVAWVSFQSYGFSFYYFVMYIDGATELVFHSDTHLEDLERSKPHLT
jgi:hypothetical protein